MRGRVGCGTPARPPWSCRKSNDTTGIVSPKGDRVRRGSEDGIRFASSFALDCFVAAQLRLRQRHSRLEEQAVSPRPVPLARVPGGGTNTYVAALGGMTRPTNIFNKSRRRKEHRAANSRAYKRQAASEYKKALDKLLYGSLGGASPVRRIDPKTGDVVAVIDPKNDPG
jgi:hypothetical protein